jgi:hypothetical protein
VMEQGTLAVVPLGPLFADTPAAEG